MNAFSRYFKGLLHQHGMTQKDYAEITESSPAHVNHLISGRRAPNYEELNKLKSIFKQVNYNEMFGDLEEENTINEPEGNYKSNKSQLRLIQYHCDEIKKITKDLDSDTNLTPKKSK